jgi:hypothetical protein
MDAHDATEPRRRGGAVALSGDDGALHTGPVHGRFAAVRIPRGSHWLVANPVTAAAPRLDHFGPHNAVEWIIWIAVIVLVGFIAWRVIDRRLPPD